MAMKFDDLEALNSAVEKFWRDGFERAAARAAAPDPDDEHLTVDERLADRLTERPGARAARLAAKRIDPETTQTWRRALGMED